MRYLRWFWANIASIRTYTLACIATGTGRVLLGLLMIWLCKRFIDVTARTGTPTDIILMIGALVTVVTGSILCRQTYYYLGIKAQAIQSTTLRLHIFSLLFRRQMFVQKEMHSGEITSRLEKDIDIVSEVLTSVTSDLIVTTIQLIGAFLFLMTMDARLAWILLLLTPPFLLMGKLIARKMRDMTKDIREGESNVQKLVQETMEHNALLRSLESEGWVTDRLDDVRHSLKNNINRRARFTVVSRFFIAFSFSLGYITAFIWGAMQLRQGLITIGVMTSFLQLVNQIQQPILQLLNMLPKVIHATASIDRLEELEDTETEASRGLSTYVTKAVLSPLGIKADDISFRYSPDERQILTHFTHDFKPKSKTAIMGHTGAGKTTLFRMMLALIKPDYGEMTIYNKNLQAPISENTRSNFVFVPQGNTLMSGSIRYNLLLAKPTATDEELEKVLHIAMADFINSLPNGLNTECGERGGGLSEGQAQRIAIARGLLRPGSILLLDEISSSLDEQTEHELYKQLFENYPDKTMLFITHRPAICKLCDEVVTIGIPN